MATAAKKYNNTHEAQSEGRHKMDILPDYVEIASSTYENVSFSKAEDSGYHTSTPSSFECDELSNQYFNPSIITNITISSITRQKPLDFNHVTPEQNFILYQPCNHSTACNVNLSETPIIRRGVKRPYPCEEKIETPTSFIAGKIKNLVVNENKENSKPKTPVHSIYFDAIDRSLFLHHDEGQIASYPSTPVKRNCNKQSPCRKSGKKIQFSTHSLSCETNGLQYSNKPRIHSKAVRNILFRSEPKIDIISRLLEAQYLPPIENIFNHLSNKDIHNFCLVSKNWNNTWNLVSYSNKRKQAYLASLKIAKENLENREKGVTPIKNGVKPKRYLKEIHNELNDNPVIPGRSPPGTPRTNRFKKFTKVFNTFSYSCTQSLKIYSYIKQATLYYVKLKVLLFVFSQHHWIPVRKPRVCVVMGLLKSQRSLLVKYGQSAKALFALTSSARTVLVKDTQVSAVLSMI